MKAAFNILPPAGENEHLHLLIEVGYYGISFSWFSRDPYQLRGLVVYHFNHVSSAAEVATAVETILWDNPVFNISQDAVTICYDFTESLLIPQAYAQEDTGMAMLDLVYGSGTGSTSNTDAIQKLDIVNVYAVDKKVEELLTGRFPGAKTFHSTSLQLEKFDPPATGIYCIIHNHSIKLFLYKDGALQVVQQFRYQKPVDVAYHMLNCCSQYDLDPSLITVRLSGMIDVHSGLYNELLKYFLNIGFEEPATGILLHERVQFYPAHFFSHLTVLMSCV